LIQDENDKEEATKRDENLNESSKDILLTESGNKILNDALKKFQTNLLKFTFVKNEKIYMTILNLSKIYLPIEVEIKFRIVDNNC
jgi:hypothetical protein